MPSATLIALVLAACAPDTLAAPPPTFCNPLNLDYGKARRGRRPDGWPDGDGLRTFAPPRGGQSAIGGSRSNPASRLASFP
jgi:hypothetical protein